MIRRFLLLNGLSILAVILFHASGWGAVAMFNWTDRYLPVAVPDYGQMYSAAYYLIRVVEQLVVFAIPAFLFVSGFFIAFATGRNRKTISLKIVGVRIRDLLIPYLLWSILLFILLAVEGRVLSPGRYLNYLATGRIDPAYYYVPLLCQFYLLSPLIVAWARTHWKSLLIVTALIQLLVQAAYYPAMLGLDAGSFQPFVDVVPKWFFAARIFWFTLGVVVGFHMKQLEQLLKRAKRLLPALAIILIPLGVVEWEMIQAARGEAFITHRETFLDSLFALTVIFTVLAYGGASLPFESKLENLAAKSYGIYLVHSPVMQYTARAVYLLVPGLLAYPLLFMILIAIVGLGVPLVAMAFINRSPARIYYKYAFG